MQVKDKAKSGKRTQAERQQKQKRYQEVAGRNTERNNRGAGRNGGDLAGGMGELIEVQVLSNCMRRTTVRQHLTSCTVIAVQRDYT